MKTQEAYTNTPNGLISGNHTFNVPLTQNEYYSIRYSHLPAVDMGSIWNAAHIMVFSHSENTQAEYTVGLWQHTLLICHPSHSLTHTHSLTHSPSHSLDK